MIHRDLVFDGVSLVDDIGLIYSSFDEKLPQPKSEYVDAVAGTDIDLTEANGIIAYSDGTHTLKFASIGDTEQERLAKTRRLLTLAHGKRADYVLPWTDTTYNGRCTVDVRHLSPLADLLTLEIKHSPYGTYSEEIVLELASTSPTATYAQAELADFHKGDSYNSVTLTTGADGAYAIGSASSSGSYVTKSSGTIHLTTLEDTLLMDRVLRVRYDDWWWSLKDETEMVLHRGTNGHATIADGEVTLDNDWNFVTASRLFTSPDYRDTTKHTATVTRTKKVM